VQREVFGARLFGTCGVGMFSRGEEEAEEKKETDRAVFSRDVRKKRGSMQIRR
jgi:hypothetical protein